jgi:predicted N-acetyltransferase YhbS
MGLLLLGDLMKGNLTRRTERKAKVKQLLRLMFGFNLIIFSCPRGKGEVAEMEFRTIVADDYEAVRRFLSELGWQHRVSDAEKFRKMLENTNRAIVAVDNSRVVGFARALCDEVSNGYISMVAVAEDRRGQGVGRELVRQLIKEDTGITWILRAGRGSKGFWEKLGFKVSEVAMERVRR